MNNENNYQALTEAVGAVILGNATPEQTAWLEERMAGDPAAFEEYERQMEIHANLALCYGSWSRDGAGPRRRFKMPALLSRAAALPFLLLGFLALAGVAVYKFYMEGEAPTSRKNGVQDAKMEGETPSSHKNGMQDARLDGASPSSPRLVGASPSSLLMNDFSQPPNQDSTMNQMTPVLAAAMFAALANAQSYVYDYYLGASESGRFNPTSYNGIGQWRSAADDSSPASPPEAGKTYYVGNGRQIRTPNAAGMPCPPFMGGRLIIDTGGQLMWTSTGGPLDIHDFVFSGSITHGENQTTPIRGNMKIPAGTTGLFNTQDADARVFVIEASVSDGGTLSLMAKNDATSRNGFDLRGNFSGFTGQVVMASNGAGASVLKKVTFTNEVNFGGALAAFRADALAVGNVVLALTGADAGISANRGITATHARTRVEVPAGLTLAVNSPVAATAGAVFTVTGGGTVLFNHAGGTAPVTVEAGSIIGGTGSISGAVVLPANTVVDLRGNGHGALGFSNPAGVTLHNATLGLDLTSSANDRLDIGGPLTLNGDCAVVFNFPGGDLNPGIYTLATYASKSGGDFVLAAPYPGATLVDGATALTLEVMDDSLPVFTVQAAPRWNGADILGYLNKVAPPQPLLLYYGSEDGFDDENEWDGANSPIAFVVDETNGGYFTGVITNGLAANTPYWARFAIADIHGDPDEWSPESIDFTTADYLQPVLGDVAFEFAPGVTNAHIHVVDVADKPVLVIAWDTEERGPNPNAWANALTNSTTVALGANTFELPGLAKGDTRAWRVFLLATGGKRDERSGSFSVGHAFTWIGATTGSRQWNVPTNWNPEGVPNGPGDRVTFPNITAAIDIAGVDGAGGALTLGGFTISLGSWETVSTTLFASDGTKIVWDNGGNPVLFNVLRTGISTFHYLFINAPQVFMDDVHVDDDSNNFSGYPIFAGTSLTGPGRLAVKKGRAAIGAAAGTTNRVDIAIEGGDGVYSIVGKGTVLFEGRVDAFRFNGNNGNLGAIGGGGSRLLLSNSVATNTATTNPLRLFMDQFHTQPFGTNTLALANESKLVFPSNTQTWFGSYPGNSVIINGPGSELRLGSVFMYGSAHRVSIEDGGLMALGMNPFQFRPSDRSMPVGDGSLVRVSSALPASPSVLDMRGFNFVFDGHNCALDLLPGGVVTNANNVQVGGVFVVNGFWANPDPLTVNAAGNRVTLAGGGLFCATLTVNTNNFLAPVIGADGLLPVLASTSATFAPGSKITPEHDDFNVQGRWMVVKSLSITLPVGDPNDPAFFTPPSKKAVYKLWQGVDPVDNTPALWLSCYKPGTILMVR